MKIISVSDQDCLIVLEKRENFLEALSSFGESGNIQSGFLLQGLGMLENIETGFYCDGEYKKEIEKSACELLSVSGNLTWKDGKRSWHVHVTLAKEDGTVFGGHLFNAEVAVTAELYFRLFPGKVFRKKVTDVFWPISE